MALPSDRLRGIVDDPSFPVTQFQGQVTNFQGGASLPSDRLRQQVQGITQQPTEPEETDNRSILVKALDLADEIATGGLITDTLTGREKPTAGQLAGQLAQTGLTVASLIPGLGAATLPAKAAIAAKTASKAPGIVNLLRGGKLGSRILRSTGAAGTFGAAAGLAEEGTVGGAGKGALFAAPFGVAIPIVGVGFRKAIVPGINRLRDRTVLGASDVGTIGAIKRALFASAEDVAARLGPSGKKLNALQKTARRIADRLQSRGGQVIKSIQNFDKTATFSQKDAAFRLLENNAAKGSAGLTGPQLAKLAPDKQVAQVIRDIYSVTEPISRIYVQTGKQVAAAGKNVTPSKATAFIPRKYREGIEAIARSKKPKSLEKLAKALARKNPKLKAITDPKLRKEAALAQARRIKKSFGGVAAARQTKFPTYQEFLDAGGDPSFAEATARFLVGNADEAGARAAFAGNKALQNLNEAPAFLQIKKEVREFVTERFDGDEADQIVKYLDRQFDILFGPAQSGAEISGKLRQLSLPKLSLAAIPNAFQPLNGLLTGTAKNWGKSFARALTPEGKTTYINSGAAVQSIIADESSIGKVVRTLLKPFKFVENWNRRWAANQGYLEAADLARKGSKEALEELVGRKVPNLSKIKEKDLLDAAANFTENIHFNSNPQLLPQWFSTPTGKAVFQFKNFIYNQTRLIFRQTAGEILANRPGNGIKNIIILTTLFPAGGATIEAIRNTITGKETDKDRGLVERWLQGMASVGAFGIFENIVSSAQFGAGTEFLAGPTASDLGRLTELVGGSIFRPVGKTAKELAKFALGRFGPAGTAVSRRVFPPQ